MRSRADLLALPGFAMLDEDSSGNPCVWRNLYCCDCPDGPRSEWESDWSCQCDDECPECGADCSPYESLWIGPPEESPRALWESLPESGAES